MLTAQLESANKSFGGWQKRFSHQSDTLKCKMYFSVYEPPGIDDLATVPVLYWLSGLTCNDQNFVTKACAQRAASELKLVIVAPDTSPRGDDIPDAEDGAYDLGLGAGFYLNATQSPWSENYHMYDYIVDELPVVLKSLYRTRSKAAIAGHSMGGHGALTIGMSNVTRFSSASAFAPIVNPSACPWGQKAFSHYLGDDKTAWNDFDACHIMHEQGKFLTLPLRIDQGLDDEFLDSQMLTRPLQSIAEQLSYPAEFYYHPGYDHSYYFIASFIEQHLLFHAKHLKNV